MNGKERNTVCEELRKGEDQYWNLWKEGKIDKFIDLFNDRFLGWPASSEEPINKEDIEGFMRDAGTLIGYTIGSFYCTVISPTSGIVYYYWARVQTINQIEISYAGRTSHTWVKEEGKWTIIGGMDGPAEVS